MGACGCWTTDVVNWGVNGWGIAGLSNFPLWRVSKVAAQKLEFRDYISAFLVAIFGIPTLSIIGLFICYILSETIYAETQAPSIAVFFLCSSLMGAVSIILVWAFLIITIPIFYLARRHGYFGLLPTNIIAMSLLITFWSLMNEARDEADILVVKYSIFIGLLYANVVWFRCRKMTPEAFQTESE
jgi:membrane-associated HD superfamily phosphohydrolase